MIIHIHLYILWICLFSYKDIIRRKMEHRVCDTARVYTATELKGIRMNVEQDRRLHILHTDICLIIRRLRLNKRWKREKTK